MQEEIFALHVRFAHVRWNASGHEVVGGVPAQDVTKIQRGREDLVLGPATVAAHVVLSDNAKLRSETKQSVAAMQVNLRVAANKSHWR